MTNNTFLPSGTKGYTETSSKSDYYGDTCNVIVTNLPGKPSVMTFHKTFSEIVHSAWYAERTYVQQNEKQTIVSTAADIVAADIRAWPCTHHIVASKKTC